MADEPPVPTERRIGFGYERGAAERPVGPIAIGELYTSPLMDEHIGGLAPKGQEGPVLGHVNLPLAIGFLSVVSRGLLNRWIEKREALPASAEA